MKKIQAIILNNIGGGFDILVDRLPLANETVMIKKMVMAEDLAKGGNIAVALSRLGIRAAIIGKIGMDEAGKRDYGWMEEAGVDLRELICDENVMTGQGIGLIADNGENIMVTGESSSKHLTCEEVLEAIDRLSPADYFIGGFEVRPQLVLPAMKYAAEKGIKTVLNPSPVPAEGLEVPLPYVDYLFVNEVESRQILGMEPSAPIEPAALCRQLRETCDCPAVVLTLGGDGAACLSEEGYFRFMPVPVTSIDASGAGDGYLAAVVAGLLDGKKLSEACRWANWFAAYSVTQRGCLPGYTDKETIERFRREREDQEGGCNGGY